MTRRVAVPVPAPRERTVGGLDTWSGALIVGGLGALLLATTSLWWGSRVWGEGWAGLVPVLALGFVGYAWANAVTGSLAGSGAWGLYAATILAEGIIRSVVVVAVLAMTASRLGWLVAVLSGLVGWIVLAGCSARVRSTRTLPLGARGPFLADASRAVLAAGCSGLAIAGFPALLQASSRAESDAALGVVIAVVVNARAPLLLLNSFQGPVIRRLTSGAAWRPGPVVAAVVGTGVLAALGGVVGPDLLLLVFGRGFTTSGELVGGVVIGVALTGAVTLTGWWALVRGQHTVYVIGWAAVVVSTVGCLALPLPLVERVLVALLLPPATGVVAHLAGVHWCRSTLRPSVVPAPNRR